MYSLHYIGYQDGTLFVTNYHGGLWAVDVSTPQARRTMPTIGVFVPDRISPKPIGRPTSYDMTPAVLDVLPLSDGADLGPHVRPLRGPLRRLAAGARAHALEFQVTPSPRLNV